MLRDRNLLAEGAGDLTDLEIPETLHALIASRLDALPEPERRLLQDGAVLGKTFTIRGLAALSGSSEEEIAPFVDDLVRKELLAVETDPFSPERGQLGFLQALVQRVTYETIARRDRRSRHLAAAQFLATGAGIDADEIAEVIATHYIDAHEADPDADDADGVRTAARTWFTRAAERAASLAASLEAQRAFVRAADLADDPVERGKALARAGRLATAGNRLEEAESLLLEAIALLDPRDARAAADAANELGQILFLTHRTDDAIARLERAIETYASEGDEAAIATASAQLARFLLFTGRQDEALEPVEHALVIAERLELYDVIVQALINKGIILRGRMQESLALMHHALLLAAENDDNAGAVRACMNLGYLLSLAGREREAHEASARGLEIARRVGDRVWERSLASNFISGCLRLGDWDEAERVAGELPQEGEVASDPVHAGVGMSLAEIALYRGQRERVLELVDPYTSWRESARVQSEVLVHDARALKALAEGQPDEAAVTCCAALRMELASTQAFAVVFVERGGEAAWLAGSAERLAEIVDLGARSNAIAPLDAALALQSARLAVLHDEPEPRFADVVERFRALGYPFWTATAQLDHAEWLISHDRQDEAATLLAEAREVFERLRAAPRLEQVAALEAGYATSSTSAPTSA
jgi:tetratricopeptide (TPR) repeat protein